MVTIYVEQVVFQKLTTLNLTSLTHVISPQFATIFTVQNVSCQKMKCSLYWNKNIL